jgi:TatD DNase family protein
MIIDSHCHLDFEVFDSDREQVLSRAFEAGVKNIIIPGVLKDTWDNIKILTQNYSHLHACYGLHPYFLDQHKSSHLDDLVHWIETENPVALGECGLDFYLKDLDKDTQQFYFEQQLDIAQQHQLPVVIHARKSTEAVITALKNRPGLSGMIHSYSGSYEQALKLIDLGFYLSFGGPITYTKANKLRNLITKLPLEYILVETDAPDQPGASYHKQRNEPSYITEVVTTIAELQDSFFEEVADITSNNAKQLFQLV